MSYVVPTFTQSEEFLVSLFKFYFSDRNVGSRRSYHRYKLRVLSAAVTELHDHQASAQDDVMPDSAEGAFATRWGDIIGIERKGATAARKDAALRLRGTATSTADEGETLTHPESGQQFALGEDVTIPVAGFIDVDVVAISTGSATRLEAGEVLVFDATPAGFESEAELQEDIDEDGFDEEQDGAFKRRYLSAFAEPQAGGNQSDYVRWSLEVDGISTAFCYPNRAGIGSVDVVAFHTGNGSSRSLSDDEREELREYLAELAPSQIGGDGGSLRVLQTVEDPQDVEILIATDDDFDWEGSATVLTIDAPNRTIQFSAARPASMKAGDRLVLKAVASDVDGEVLVIESLSSTDSIILEDWPTEDPAATDIAYPAGPYTAKVRDAIIAHMNGEIVYADQEGPLPESVAAEQNTSTVGLNILAEGIGPANPDREFGPWSGSLVRAVLDKLATYTRGVSNASVTTPAADYDAEDPAFPDDEAIDYISPGNVLVRGA
jgi:uncharacterized phage protein gp47/JayE